MSTLGKISDCGWGALFYSGVLLESLTRRILFLRFFCICEARGSRYCTERVISLCVVRGWSRERKLGPILTVLDVEMAGRIAGWLLLGASSDKPATPEGRFDAVLKRTVRIQFIFFFQRNSIQCLNRSTWSTQLHRKSGIPLRKISRVTISDETD